MMNAKALFGTILLTLVFSRFGFAQGGPYLVDYIWRGAWPNPVINVVPASLDPDVPDTVLLGQTNYVPNTDILAAKQKDYYWFQDKDKQSGYAHKLQIDHAACRVWLEWNGLYYPSNGEYDCQVEALPLDQLDPKCFATLGGPYCNISSGVTYVGQANGYPMVAFGGLFRRMGAAFTASQVDKILFHNNVHNDGVLRSDLRADLVNEFLELFPEIDAAEIPIDTFGDELTDDSGAINTAVVCHIIPAIAPEGYTAGRNAYSNAMVVSANMKEKLTNPKDDTGYMPSDAMLLYFEFLASKYSSKVVDAGQSKFTAQYVSDLKSIDGEVEYLTEDETLLAMKYAGMIRTTKKTRE